MVLALFHKRRLVHLRVLQPFEKWTDKRFSSTSQMCNLAHHPSLLALDGTEKPVSRCKVTSWNPVGGASCANDWKCAWSCQIRVQHDQRPLKSYSFIFFSRSKTGPVFPCNTGGLKPRSGSSWYVDFHITTLHGSIEWCCILPPQSEDSWLIGTHSDPP